MAKKPPAQSTKPGLTLKELIDLTDAKIAKRSINEIEAARLVTRLAGAERIAHSTAEALAEELGVDPVNIAWEIGDPDEPYQTMSLGLLVDDCAVHLKIVVEVVGRERRYVLLYLSERIATIQPVPDQNEPSATKYVVSSLSPEALQRAAIDALGRPRLSDPDAPASGRWLPGAIRGQVYPDPPGIEH